MIKWVIFGLSVYPNRLTNTHGILDIRNKGSVAYSSHSADFNRIVGSQEEGGQEVRSDFPETWLWDLYLLP